MKKYISMMAMALMLSMSFTACSVETDEKPGGDVYQVDGAFPSMEWVLSDENLLRYL